LTAIRIVAGGDAVLAPTATRRLIDQFVPLLPDPGQLPDRDALLSRLTDRERAVFARLAAGLSNREIAGEMHLSQGIVKIHVGRILAKLDLRDRVQAVVLGLRVGPHQARQPVTHCLRRPQRPAWSRRLIHPEHGDG
jgi:DNA-binding NarL/FixJ family response regulator